jgi:hypothetical protein
MFIMSSHPDPSRFQQASLFQMVITYPSFEAGR